MFENDKSRNISYIGGSVYGALGSGSVYGANQVGGSDKTHFVQQSEQKQTLADAAKEIQQLLEQLAKINPNPTEAEKIEYVHDETSPSFKRRLISALQAGGEAAIEEFLDTRYVIVGKAIVKGWMKPE